MWSPSSSAPQTSVDVAAGQRGRRGVPTASGRDVTPYAMGMDLALPAGPTGARGAGRVSAARRSLADAAPPPSHNVLVDVDGLRCEVRSMRSVPHALYSTPSVSHVLATYVQQLIDDFTRSLLLCRPAQRSSSSISSRVIQAESGDPQRQKQLQSTTTTTLCAADLTVDGALSSEDEETYLLLRLSEQLIALFAAADRPCCRHGPNGGAREEDSEQHDAAVLMPPLLSSLLLFKPMLHDMRYLAQHLLLPRHAWQHHQREWVIVYEDVAVTLRDRLSRYRRASMRSRGRDGEVVTNDEDGTEDRDAASILTGMQRLFPASELQHLWHTLWELLGAAWRQRDRLWGAYRYLHGPRRLPPLCLSGQAPCAVPPGVHACPIMREQYEAYIARVHALTASPSHAVPDAPAAPHAEDSCAFGPFTSADIGISARRLYVLRQPLAAVLRTLRVSVPPAGRDPLVTSATAPVGFQYVDDPVPNGQANTPAPTTDAATPLVVPLFDTTNQDAQLAAAAVPYVSPEVYVSLQQERQRQRRRAASCSALPVVSWPPVHSFSDDVWNAAVVVLEAALSGFCATDASMCHLALPSVHSSGVDLLDERTAMSRSSSSSSVYSGVLLLLTERHVLPRAAAHNFLYAALYHLQVALNKGGCEDDGGILAEVASKGLCWRRSERWNAFGMAHVTATTAKHLSGRHHGPAAFAMPALADTSVGVGTPGDADGGRDAAALSRLPQRLDRTFNALDTPLLRLLSLEHYRAAPEGKAGSAGVSPAGPKLSREAAATVNRPACGAADDAGDLWAVLSSYLRRCTMTAAATGASATPAGKANGAVTEAADADCVDELLRLLFCCLVRTTRCYRVHDGARTAFAGSAACKGDAPVDVEWCQYAAMNHPFFRGVAERGLLTTDFAFATATLPALNLYVPAAVLLATVREMEATWKVSGVDVCSERVVKQATSLRTLIGDDMRAWEASAAARGGGSGGRMHQQQQQYLLLANPFVDMAATLLPSPVHRARRALDGVLSPIDFDLAAQLDHTHQLRRLLYSDSDDAAGDDRGRGKKGAAAARVRAYLKSLLMPNTERGTDGVDSHVVYSPFYPLPPTLRGEVWGCLLCVPPSACAREALLAHAVHHTAAKPTPHDRQLSVDIPRCHAYHPLLSSSSGSAQLKRILRAWLYLHPEHAYWQGLDSVCAVLLTVSNRDEALVLAQLNALVNRFIAHDEDCERPRASGIGSGAVEQLRRLVVVLRYCDPLLAHYLFDVLGCTPELYAISWLLTLFSHSLPTRKVYLLWDLLFVEDDAACLVVLCAVVIIHKREVLLSTDFSGCLASFSSGASSINVAAAVGDARWLMRAVPPSVLAPPPPVSSDDRKDAQQSLYGSSAAAISEGADCDREEGSSGPHWFDSGVYLVDVREQPAEKALRDSVLGAISVPLCTAARRKAHASAGSGAALQRREVSDACASAVADEVGDVDSDAADAAAAIVRHVGNPAMAAIIPRVWRATKNHAAPPLPPPQPSLLSCPWPVHPIVLKASRAPHVVLLTSGVVDAHELPLAHQLGVKLNACGVHNVSILRGGVASVRRALPELVVRRAPST
ncbi:Rab-GTPase-TBC domain family protein [Leishmania donovani]|uniref:Rab-GTPase-TBC domain family protein n=1 Tax=Leishmania donovani TaxID=5661 RepID=A0A504XLJ8_LEIDO|nr:Rab-GTPase-TBC domain family protein [Leishmania donovani]